MDVVLLCVAGDPDPAAAALRAHGASVTSHVLPGRPERVALDAVLDDRGDRRLVIAGATSDVALVLRRLMRRQELTTAETAVLPDEDTPFLARFGITPQLSSAARIAVSGELRTVGVIKDDSGNLMIDHAELRPWQGDAVWVRCYVDDTRLCDGVVSGLRVERGPRGGVRVSLPPRRWRAAPSLLGRALTLACDDAAISSDGSERDQPRRKRIWWDESDQWRLATGLPSA